MENKYIRISDISAYLLCPRLAYFRRRRRGPDVSAEMVRAAVFKEVSRGLAAALETEDPEATLRLQIEAACRDAEIVYGLATDDVMAEATGAVRDILGGLREESARMGRDHLLDILSPCERPRTIFSDRLRISGNVDRIVLAKGAILPVLVCAAKPPANGIYAADRVKLAACLMLAEEKLGKPASRGAVEYVLGWAVRETDVRRNDRMAVLSTRNRIVQMGSAMPAARKGTWCNRCGYLESCMVKVSFLEGLFRPRITDNIGLSRKETNK